MTEQLLLSSRSGRVLTLALNRPHALNAITRELAEALRHAVDGAGRDSSLGAIILTGSGRAFSAGADLRQMEESYEKGDRLLGEQLRQNYSPLIRSLRTCPLPVIAAINGAAAGAGLSLALACDLRIAASDARLTLAFVRIGLVPDAGSLFFLSRLIGFGRAMEMALIGEPVTAEEALRIGLVNRVAESGHLISVAGNLADSLANGPAKAQTLIKRGLERALSLDLEQSMELEAQLQNLAATTKDHQEAIRAFLEKRKPEFGAPD